jgi:sporulation protein YlmC with PRC-barrel domain
MIRNILAVTAFAAFAATAQAETNTTASTENMTFLVNATTNAHLASRLIGEPVYNSNQQDAETIGQINDLIVSNDGTVEAVVLGVGGFIGIGEKTVAVEFENLSWTSDPNDQTAPRLVMTTTVEQLEGAPEFDVSVFDMDPMDRPADMTTDQTAMTTDPATAPMATDPALAPTGDQLAAVPDRNALGEVDVSTMSVDNLIGTTVYSADNDNVGSVGDVILAADGSVDAVVLDIGGFLGMGQKPVAIAFEALNIRRDEDGTLYVYTGFTREQLEAAADYDRDTYHEHREIMRLNAPA